VLVRQSFTAQVDGMTNDVLHGKFATVLRTNKEGAKKHFSRVLQFAINGAFTNHYPTTI
jgi:hypothetical protein